jgi:methyltransferase-like protein
MRSPSLQTSYDDLPYPGQPYGQTHPGRLATIATLLGLTPPPAERCRVLEIGCGSGGNLIPMALGLPLSTFLGIDLSTSEIARGCKTIEALGLSNIELRQLSILDVDDRLGTFDYILCHGVYSWVPAAVQGKILDIYGQHLTRHGIGYVSYNVYPGWHLSGMVRDMLSYHARRYCDEPPDRRVARARALLDFLARVTPRPEGVYAQILREKLAQLRDLPDAYLFHEYLEEENTPVYFRDLCARLAARGLRYLADSAYHLTAATAALAPELRKGLDELTPDLLEKEQYLDFVYNRSLRETLLCRHNLQPDYNVRGERLLAFPVTSPLRPMSATPDLTSNRPQDFQGLAGMQLSTAVPVVKAALTILGEGWPQAVRLTALPALARQRLGLPAADAEAERQDLLALTSTLLLAYASAGDSLVTLSLSPPAFTDRVSERPQASPLARLQAAGGLQATNLRHGTTTLDPFDAHLLPLLDGTRDRPGLLQALVNRFEQRSLHIALPSGPVTDVATARALINDALDQHLTKLARGAVLLG